MTMVGLPDMPSLTIKIYSAPAVLSKEKIKNPASASYILYV
jgi:hypothetical protein